MARRRGGAGTTDPNPLFLAHAVAVADVALALGRVGARGGPVSHLVAS